MKVVLVNANTVKPPLAPIGLLYVSSFLKSRGVETEIVDLCPEPDIPAALASVAARRPDLIGVSIRNIDSTQMKQPRYFLPEAVAIVKDLKRLCPGVPVVLGGAGFSLEPLDIMRLSGADYGVVGEGEAALYELAKSLEDCRDPAGIAGVIRQAPDGNFVLNPHRNAGADFLEALPFQDVGAVDYSYYYNEGGMASLQTKRGCALRCNYCTYPLIEGRRYRLLPPQRIVDEMEFLVLRGFDYFHFTDSIFNVPRSHALDVCREIIRRRLPVKWHTYMSPFGFDEELGCALKEAGNDGVFFGVDSCSDQMLREMGKNFTKWDIARAARVCRELGMEFSLSILFGSPGETSDTVMETLGAVDLFRPTAAFLTQGIRVYRGTPVHRRLVAEGKLKRDHPLLEPYFFISEALPADLPERLRRYARARNFVFTDTLDKAPGTDPDVVALHKRNVRGPCWKILRELGKSRASLPKS